MTTAPAAARHGHRRWAARAAAAVLASAALLGVFALYRRPAFLVGLAEQLWSCF